MALLQVGDKDYIVYSEMKSNFDEKAIWQISSSVVRTKLLLSSIKDFGLENYQELGIIISYPMQVETKIDDNESFKINKRKMITTYRKDKLQWKSLEEVVARQAVCSTTSIFYK